MKVRELIEQLEQLDPELDVFKQKDDEGNGYSAVNGADDDSFIDKSIVNAWEVEVLTKEDVGYMIEEYGGDEDQYRKVVVIY